MRAAWIIEDPLPLFEGEAWVIEERRLAWLYRIELLREWGRLTEALAYRAANPDKTAAYRTANRKRILKRQAAYRAAHRLTEVTNKRHQQTGVGSRKQGR